MSSPSPRIRQLVFATIMFAAFGAGLYLWVNRSAGIADLETVRVEAGLILSEFNPKLRRAHALECASKAGLLLGEQGVLDSTARLYLIAVAPVTGADVSKIDVPEGDLVREVASEDLMLITRIFSRTNRLGPADQLIDLILSRKDVDRSMALELAMTIRIELGRDEDVLNHADELISLHPDDPDPYHFKGRVFRTRGQWDYFVDAMERAVELTDFDDPVLKIELADGYIQLGRTSDGRRLVDEIAEDHADLLAQAPIMQARLLLQEGKIARSTAILDEFLARVPDDGEALIVKGTLLLGQEKYQDAIDVLDRAIASSPSEELAYYQMGQAYARLGKKELATAFLKKHREILDAKVRLFDLERQAALEPHNADVRKEISDLYATIGLKEQSDFWRRAAETISE